MLASIGRLRERDQAFSCGEQLGIPFGERSAQRDVVAIRTQIDDRDATCVGRP